MSEASRVCLSFHYRLQNFLPWLPLGKGEVELPLVKVTQDTDSGISSGQLN